MIRSSNRKIAGSRFNKKVKHHYITQKEYQGKFPNIYLVVDYQFAVVDMTNPNHEARFANISDCFPLAGQRNLKKWKS